MKCPKCHAKTEVLETVQKDGSTRRRRQCVSPKCELRFTTSEAALDANRPAGVERPTEAIRNPFSIGTISKRLRDPGFKGSGKYDPEALAAALAVDRRKAEIARAQHKQRKFDRVEWSIDPAPDRLDEMGLRKELEGY